MYTSKHLLIRVAGFFGTGASSGPDQWSAGFRMGVAGGDVTYDATKLLTLVTAIYDHASLLMQKSGVWAGTNCKVQSVTGAAIGQGGKYDPAQQITQVYVAPTAQAGLGTPDKPWNTAGVISLRTANPRGYASNGRFYYPALALPLDINTGRVTAPVMAQRVVSFGEFFDNVNGSGAAYQAGLRVRVFSNVGAGTTATVTSIRADNRVDSIENRENDQPSIWSVQALA